MTLTPGMHDDIGQRLLEAFKEARGLLVMWLKFFV